VCAGAIYSDDLNSNLPEWSESSLKVHSARTLKKNHRFWEASHR